MPATAKVQVVKSRPRQVFSRFSGSFSLGANILMAMGLTQFLLFILNCGGSLWLSLCVLRVSHFETTYGLPAVAISLEPQVGR